MKTERSTEHGWLVNEGRGDDLPTLVPVSFIVEPSRFRVVTGSHAFRYRTLIHREGLAMMPPRVGRTQRDAWVHYEELAQRNVRLAEAELVSACAKLQLARAAILEQDRPQAKAKRR